MKFTMPCPWCRQPRTVHAYNLGRHPVVEVRYKRQRIHVDRIMAPLLQILWKSGVDTAESCQAQAPHQCAASITFPNTTEAEKFMRRVLGWAPEALADRAVQRWIWTIRAVHMDISGRFEVRVVFPRRDIKALIRSLQRASA